MAAYKKALIVVHRNENADDFQQIARRIRKLDPSIGVTMVSDFLTSKMLPPECLNLPKKLVLQYNAWDRAAEALVRKTHELAT